MKLKFNPNLDYQLEAIDAIVDIFEGNPINQSNFTVAPLLGQQGLQDTDLGIGNRLDPNFDEDDILKNVRAIQLRNGLSQSKEIQKNKYHFTVEMETGTGKTYVYLRTIFELNAKYGFSKFIIVIPSVAIKEGVMKSIDMMTDHFQQKYDNVVFSANEYKSKNIEIIRNFATNDHIQIMVMTVQSFNKDTNVINRDHERTNGLKPLDFIRDTNPIVIIDEPQSTVSTQKANDAIMSLNPMCTLRYSATHRELHNLMYRLDAVDAYQRQLVKEIVVASVVEEDQHNNDYLNLISVDNRKTPITAKVEIDKRKKGKISREVIKVKKGDDLFELSGGREQYSGYQITEIYAGAGEEYLNFSAQEFLSINGVRGGIPDDEIKRMQIKKTIEKHLEKELQLNKQGIKVLSLFFIDKVSNYRIYDEDGNESKGKYAQWFEEEYKKIIIKPMYKELLEDKDNLDLEAEAIHNGYFAKDKKGKLKNTKGNTLADEDIYGLIMRDKERLLSFNSKLKFIFSHSALKEGWDSPNVFQICTLNETKSEMKKRQEIGRGLRLAVNQAGERQQGFQINSLTVMTNESYQDFVDKLQKEIESEGGIKFGIIEEHTFANIVIAQEDEKAVYLGEEASIDIWNFMKEKLYIDDKGKVEDKLKIALKENTIQLPQKYKNSYLQIKNTIRKIAGSLNIKNDVDKVKIKLNKQRYLSPEFKALWDRIKFKTTYTVTYDSRELIRLCSEEIMNNLKVDKSKLIYTEARTDVDKGGVYAVERDRYGTVIENTGYILPDIITYLQNDTNLTRKTLVKILLQSSRLNDFKSNPQKFMDEVSIIIRRKMRHFIIDGIKYEKLDDEIYAQSLFDDKELFGYLHKNMIPSDKSVYDYVVYDSGVEEEFAKKFEANNRVKVYAKLPAWFSINTPLGGYNPDWAVFIEKDGEEKLYFVLETKGNIISENLRPTENAKIQCGKNHFKALNTGVEFNESDNFNNFIENI